MDLGFHGLRVWKINICLRDSLGFGDWDMLFFICFVYNVSLILKMNRVISDFFYLSFFVKFSFLKGNFIFEFNWINWLNISTRFSFHDIYLVCFQGCCFDSASGLFWCHDAMFHSGVRTILMSYFFMVGQCLQ